jgi:hypothetical protein
MMACSLLRAKKTLLPLNDLRLLADGHATVCTVHFLDSRYAIWVSCLARETQCFFYKK